MDESGPPKGRHLAVVESELCPGRGGQLGDGPGVAERERRLEIDVVGDGQQRRIELLVREHDGQRRFGVDDRRPRLHGVEVTEDRRRRRRRGSSASAGSNCVPARRSASAQAASTPWTRWATSTYSASCAIRDAIGTSSPARVPRPALAVPLLVRVAERVARHLRKPELLGQHPGQHGVLGDHALDVVTPVQRELDAGPDPLQRRAARRRSGGARRPPRGSSSARRRTCRPSGRCRRRTTSPARGRRCGSRR